MTVEIQSPAHDALVEAALATYSAVSAVLHSGRDPWWLQLDVTINQLKGLFLLVETNRGLTAASDAGTGTPVQGERQAGGLTVGAMAAALGLGRPAASILVEGLVQHRLVERREDPLDRRRTIVQLSPTAQGLVTRLYDGEQAHLRSLFARLDTGDLDALARGLRALDATAGPRTQPASRSHLHAVPIVPQTASGNGLDQ